MATIYRFIIENKVVEGEGRKPREKTGGRKATAKKGGFSSIFGGSKGGVEHNRKMRAINPLLNKATGGVWEKAMRVGRAGLGLVKVNSETGALGFSWTAAAILIAFAIQTTLKIQNIQRERADKQNNQNYKQLENGISAIHGQYSITRNYWDGKMTYNENK